MQVKQRIICWGDENHTSGILTEPTSTQKSEKPIIILLNAGIVYRIGPNRIYVKIAQKLAESGYASLRFDFSGTGDAEFYSDEHTFNDYQVNEVIDAINALDSQSGTHKIVLIGICSGADVALNTALIDNRIHGIFLINIQQFFNAEKYIGKAKNDIRKRYYKKYMFDYSRWINLLRGKSKLFKNIRERFNSKKTYQVDSVNKNGKIMTQIDQLIKQRKKILFVFSEGSLSIDLLKLTVIDEFISLKNRGKLDFKIIKDTDHIFTQIWSQDYLLEILVSWMNHNDHTGFSENECDGFLKSK